MNMLEANQHNRPLSDGHVHRIADQIKAGKWKFNDGTIKVAENGDILDGQHRCWAVIFAKIAVAPRRRSIRPPCRSSPAVNSATVPVVAGGQFGHRAGRGGGQFGDGVGGGGKSLASLGRHAMRQLDNPIGYKSYWPPPSQSLIAPIPGVPGIPENRDDRDVGIIYEIRELPAFYACADQQWCGWSGPRRAKHNTHQLIGSGVERRAL